MIKKSTNLEVLKYAAKKLGYKFELLDPDYSEAIIITDGSKHFISRSKTMFGMYPTNYKFAESLVDDKATTKKILKRFGFRIIKGKRFYISSTKGGNQIKPEHRYTAAYKYAEEITYPVFVKPNNGSRGFNARIIFTENGLKSHIKKMRNDKVGSFLVEKFTQRPEYRLFIVNGRVKFMYRKKRISITGTGKHTIKELIELLNVPHDKTLLKNILKTKNKTESTVLRKRHEVLLQETGNISQGAEIINYTEKVPKNVALWAKKLYQTTGLNVFAVDFFTKGKISEPEKYLIIEINSSPALSGIFNLGHKDRAVEIWGEIMKTFFTKRS